MDFIETWSLEQFRAVLFIEAVETVDKKGILNSMSPLNSWKNILQAFPFYLLFLTIVDF